MERPLFFIDLLDGPQTVIPRSSGQGLCYYRITATALFLDKLYNSDYNPAMNLGFVYSNAKIYLLSQKSKEI